MCTLTGLLFYAAPFGSQRWRSTDRRRTKRSGGGGTDVPRKWSQTTIHLSNVVRGIAQAAWERMTIGVPNGGCVHSARRRAQPTEGDSGTRCVHESQESAGELERKSERR